MCPLGLYLLRSIGYEDPQECPQKRDTQKLLELTFYKPDATPDARPSMSNIVGNSQRANVFSNAIMLRLQVLCRWGGIKIRVEYIFTTF